VAAVAALERQVLPLLVTPLAALEAMVFSLQSPEPRRTMPVVAVALTDKTQAPLPLGV
jgi:hypothetical protein